MFYLVEIFSMLYYKMVLSEQQKKELVERLRLGREQKAAEKAAPKKAAKPERAAKPEKGAPKPAAPVEISAVPALEEPKEAPVTTDKPPKKVEPKAEPCIFEGIEAETPRGLPSSRKEKRLNKQKYMAIKFYEKPDEKLYKKVMKSVQPDSSSDDEPLPNGAKFLDYEKAEKTVITEAQRADIERQKMDAIYKLLG